MKTSVNTSNIPEEVVEGVLPKSVNSWERLTRLELVVKQLVKDSEKMDTRIDTISKSQEKIESLIRTTRNIVVGAFGAMVLQIPELLTHLPDILRLLSAS
jgi:hypothetical protein